MRTVEEWLEKSHWWGENKRGEWAAPTYFLSEYGTWQIIGVDLGPGGDLATPTNLGIVTGTLKKAIAYAIETYGESFYGWGYSGEFKRVYVQVL